MIVTVRLYACALVFAVWAVSWWMGVRGPVVTGVFLSMATFAFVVSEAERGRQRRLNREDRR